MQRIWNEEELRSMPEWIKDNDGYWVYSDNYWCISPKMLGQEITDDFKKLWNVCNYMIAKEPKEETIKQNNMETKKVTLKNGTVLEVGKKYRLSNSPKGEFLEIMFIDFEAIYGRDEDGDSEIANTYVNWLPYTEPTPQKEWKTFLIERGQRAHNGRVIVQFQSIEDAKSHYPNAVSITEVKITIEEVK